MKHLFETFTSAEIHFSGETTKKKKKKIKYGIWAKENWLLSHFLSEGFFFSASKDAILRL